MNETCKKKYLELLEIKYQKAIVYVFIKYEILHVEVTHKAFIPELKFKSDLLLETLSKVEDCNKFKADTVVVFCNVV